ncbi:response regulator [Salirhabdus salicampi]|uniref:response regulator n=1 Tax=Salirhabdus salicampi TaxID=476102 RepID=UPI0020C36677|nr:response regulator [Salirhabdus salicampi]MCP8617411.1 response regulator [Salirhabdus salicampi]
MEKRKIYVVDDQFGIRLLLKEIIEMEGHEVYDFETGGDALQQMESQQPDLLFIDYRLPLMNGIELVEKMTLKGISAPIVMMSGLSEQDIEGKSKFTNIKHVLLKPFNIEEVKRILQLHLSQ